MLSCQDFKFAFLKACVEQGLTPTQTLQVVKTAVEKQAIPAAVAAIPGVGFLWGLGENAGSAAVRALPTLGTTAFLGSAIAGGGLGGYGLAKLQSLSDEDPHEIQTKEKIQAYRQAVQQAAIQQRLRQQREGSRPRRPLLA